MLNTYICSNFIEPSKTSSRVQYVVACEKRKTNAVTFKIEQLVNMVTQSMDFQDQKFYCQASCAGRHSSKVPLILLC